MTVKVNHVVSSMSTRDRKILEELVHDTIIFGLNEQESLDYIKRRAMGIPVSRSNFYAVKKRISQKEEHTLQQRLTNHARVGYAVSHFRVIDQIEATQKILFQTLLEESSISPSHVLVSVSLLLYSSFYFHPLLG